MILKVAVASGSALGAMFLIDRFVLRESDDSPTGFITKAPGFGVDDIVMGVGIAVAVLAALKFVPGAKG